MNTPTLESRYGALPAGFPSPTIGFIITLEGIIELRHRRGVRTVLTAVQPRVRKSLARFGILKLLGPGNLFENTIDAIMAIEPPAPASPKHEPPTQAQPPSPTEVSTPTAA